MTLLPPPGTAAARTSFIPQNPVSIRADTRDAHLPGRGNRIVSRGGFARLVARSHFHWGI
jgi:hypothetical protein